VHAVNKKIEDRLRKRRLIFPSTEFYENRPIMITANNYELGLFNGDTGIIRKNEKGTSMAWFEDSEGGLKGILPAFINRAETVFAMTIHKSQGSEFNRILIMLPQKQDISILTRELLYTGITRAREKAIVLGTREVVLQASRQRVKRASGIIDRFMD
jgi:exodeoxyribonuclease V alpha subunit